MKRTLKALLLLLLVALMGTVFILRTDAVSDAVRNATRLCADTVVPSLFPFLVLSSFIVSSGLIRTSGKLLSAPARLFFNLPGEAGTAVFMGLIGGFPVGPKMTAQLYKSGIITKLEAQTMLLFTLNAGPAFVIGTVGSGMLGNTSVGALLFFSMVFASLTVGLLVCTRLSPRKPSLPSKAVHSAHTEVSLGEALCQAVEHGTASIFSICAFVILFAAITAVLGEFIKDPELLTALTAVLEVTSGCKSVSAATPSLSINSLPIIAAVLSFGGLCVHCQVLDCIRAVQLSFAEFLGARISCAVLAGLFCRTVLLIFPQKYEVFSNMALTVDTNLSVSYAACASLLLMSVLLILDLDIKEELC